MNHFIKNFDTIFMKNIKNCQKIYCFFFFFKKKRRSQNPKHEFWNKKSANHNLNPHIQKRKKKKKK